MKTRSIREIRKQQANSRRVAKALAAEAKAWADTDEGRELSAIFAAIE